MGAFPQNIQVMAASQRGRRGIAEFFIDLIMDPLRIENALVIQIHGVGEPDLDDAAIVGQIQHADISVDVGWFLGGKIHPHIRHLRHHVFGEDGIGLRLLLGGVKSHFVVDTLLIFEQEARTLHLAEHKAYAELLRTGRDFASPASRFAEWGIRDRQLAVSQSIHLAGIHQHIETEVHHRIDGVAIDITDFLGQFLDILIVIIAFGTDRLIRGSACLDFMDIAL